MLDPRTLVLSFVAHALAEALGGRGIWDAQVGGTTFSGGL